MAALPAALAAIAVATPHPRGEPVSVRQGRLVFEQACSGCHTVAGRDRGAQGGDLAVARLSTEQIASFARTMPVRLSNREIAAVAAYIHFRRLGNARR